ncbi:MAG: hypothetical protein ACPGJE_02200 [Wenzhouxiangellaceae bacterium]
MQRWFATICNIVLLRAGPQDLPCGLASPLLALILFVLVMLASGVIGQSPQPGAPIGAAMLISIGLPLLAVLALLTLRRKPERFNQTTAALFGAGALISLINVPLWLNDTLPVPAPLVMLALLGLFWSIAVDGHIWRNALDIGYAGGVAIAVAILFAQLAAFQGLTGGTA